MCLCLRLRPHTELRLRLCLSLCLRLRLSLRLPHLVHFADVLKLHSARGSFNELMVHAMSFKSLCRRVTLPLLRSLQNEGRKLRSAC